MNLTDILSNKLINTFNPYIIAEAGVNHEGNMDLAKRLIEEAKKGGANAIKFQTYKANTIAIKDSPSYWDLSEEPITSQFKLFQKYDKFWKNEFEELKKYCDSIEIEFMSTPFDLESAKFLNDLMNVYKISSSDLNNKPFIEYICDFNKPIILSTGASNFNEINRSVNWIKKFNIPLSLLHCILNYPTLDKNANLFTIKKLIELYPNITIGYSDHTLPNNDMKILEIASLLGARIIEKHFTYDKKLKGNDHYHSMDFKDLKLFKKNIKNLQSILGTYDKNKINSIEHKSIKNARRSLVSNKFIPKGKKITLDDLTYKRPGTGISPDKIDEIIGKKAALDINDDLMLTYDMFL